VSHCPKKFPAGYFWYGSKCKGTGKLPRWVEELLNGQEKQAEPPEAATDEVLDAGLDEKDGVSETEPVAESEEEATEATDSTRNRGTYYTLRSSIKPPRRYV